MPRTSIWFNPDQLDDIHRTFGEGVNLSGIIRAGLGCLLALSGGKHAIDMKLDIAALDDLEADAEALEIKHGKAARDRVERRAKP